MVFRTRETISENQELDIQKVGFMESKQGGFVKLALVDPLI